MNPMQAQQQSAMANALRGAGHQQAPGQQGINPVPAPQGSQGPQGPQGAPGGPPQGQPQQPQQQQANPLLMKRLMTGGTPPL